MLALRMVGLWTAIVVLGQLGFSQNINQQTGFTGLWGFFKQEGPEGSQVNLISPS